MKRHLDHALRGAVLAAHDGLCQYCRAAPAEEVDHIIAFSKGGAHEPENLIPSCPPCNASKSDGALPSEVLERVRSLAISVAPIVKASISSAEGRRKMAPFARLEIFPTAALKAEIDAWRAKQPGLPAAADAARRLIRKGLDADAEITRLRALLAAAGVDACEPDGGTP